MTATQTPDLAARIQRSPLTAMALVGALMALTAFLASFVTVQLVHTSDPTAAAVAAAKADIAKERDAAKAEITTARDQAIKDAATKPANPVGYIQTAGTSNDPDNRSYACASGYSAVKLPTGRATNANGTTITTKVTMAGPESYDDQLSVTVDGQLNAHQTLPVVIVNTGAHSHYPELYPQTVYSPHLGANGSFHFVLNSRSLADNYGDEGVTDLTFCFGTV